MNVLLRQGRFNGAEKIGNYWVIPREAVENFTRLKPGVKSRTKQQHEEDKALIENALEAMKSARKADISKE